VGDKKQWRLNELDARLESVFEQFLARLQMLEDLAADAVARNALSETPAGSGSVAPAISSNAMEVPERRALTEQPSGRSDAEQDREDSRLNALEQSIAALRAQGDGFHELAVRMERLEQAARSEPGMPTEVVEGLNRLADSQTELSRVLGIRIGAIEARLDSLAKRTDEVGELDARVGGLERDALATRAGLGEIVEVFESLQTLDERFDAKDRQLAELEERLAALAAGADNFTGLADRLGVLEAHATEPDPVPGEIGEILDRLQAIDARLDMERDAQGDAAAASTAQLAELEELSEEPAPSDEDVAGSSNLTSPLVSQMAPARDAVETPEEQSAVTETEVVVAPDPSSNGDVGDVSREFVFAAAPSLPAKEAGSAGGAGRGPSPVANGRAASPSSNGLAYATNGAASPTSVPDGQHDEVVKSFIVAPDSSPGTVLTPFEAPSGTRRRFKLFRRR